MNKMDRVGADFFASVQSLIDRLGAKPVPVQLPLGKEDGFRGVIDLLTMKALVFDDETLGAAYSVQDIPEEYLASAKEYREKLLDAVVEFDESAMERYLNGDTLGIDEIKRAIRLGTVGLKINPVFCGSAFKNKGVQPLLDGVVDYLPSPVDLPPVVGIDPVRSWR